MVARGLGAGFHHDRAVWRCGQCAHSAHGGGQRHQGGRADHLQQRAQHDPDATRPPSWPRRRAWARAKAYRPALCRAGKLLAGDGAAQAVLQQVQAARKAYEPLQNETQELAGSGQVFDAKELLVEKMHPAQQAYFSAMDALLQQIAAAVGPGHWRHRAGRQRRRGMLLVTTLVVMVLGACWPGGSSAPSPALCARRCAWPVRWLQATCRSHRAQGATKWRSCCWVLKDMQGALARRHACARVRKRAGRQHRDCTRATWTCPTAPRPRPVRWKKPSASMQELRDAVAHNADNAQQANTLARRQRRGKARRRRGRAGGGHHARHQHPPARRLPTSLA